MAQQKACDGCAMGPRLPTLATPSSGQYEQVVELAFGVSLETVSCAGVWC